MDAAGDEPLKGEIISVSPFKDAMTQVYPVKILVPNEQGLLKSGMFARVKLMVALHPEAVTVPEEAVVAYDGKRIVYTLEGDVAKANVVETGPTSMGKTVILNGLEAGKEIIVEGQDLLTDGAKVKVQGRGDTK